MIKICQNCKKEYEAYDKPVSYGRTRFKLKRRHNSLTCSRECSRIFNRRKRKKEEDAKL